LDLSPRHRVFGEIEEIAPNFAKNVTVLSFIDL